MRHALLLAALLYGTAANAQVLHEDTIAQGGLMCDTEEEVKQFIAVLEASSMPEALQAITGCGILTRPARIKIEATNKVSTDKGNYLIVSYEFIEAPLPRQYGIGAFKKLSSL